MFSLASMDEYCAPTFTRLSALQLELHSWPGRLTTIRTHVLEGHLVMVYTYEDIHLWNWHEATGAIIMLVGYRVSHLQHG